MQIISGIQREGAANQTQTEIFLFHLQSHLDCSSSKCLPNKESGERKMTRVLFSAKIPHRPPTRCLSLSLSPPSWSVSFVRSLLFAQNFTIKCLPIPQRPVLCCAVLCCKLGGLGPPAYELDQVATENKGR